MTRFSDAIAEFHSLVPIRFPNVRKFEIAQAVGSHASGLTLLLELVPDSAGSSLLSLSFEQVTDLKIDWPQGSVVQVDVIEITDVSGRGLEDIYYRVSDGGGLFAFSCRDFRARWNDFDSCRIRLHYRQLGTTIHPSAPAHPSAGRGNGAP